MKYNRHPARIYPAYRIFRMESHPASGRTPASRTPGQSGSLSPLKPELYALTKIKHYFIEQMKELVEEEEALLKEKGKVPAADILKQAKLDGFSDKYLSQILEVHSKASARQTGQSRLPASLSRGCAAGWKWCMMTKP
mgnify:CR=1 FL=1